MSIKILHQRYLNIANKSLFFLKKEGFKKSGQRSSKQKGEIIFEIYARIPRGWINSETYYEFQIDWSICTKNTDYLSVCKFIENEKTLTKIDLIGSNICIDYFGNKCNYLQINDPENLDDQFIQQFQFKIKNDVLPFFETIESIENIISVAEKELDLDKEKRLFFPYGSEMILAFYYASKNWKNKTLDVCDKNTERTPETAKDLSIKRKKKFIKYFEEKGL